MSDASNIHPFEVNRRSVFAIVWPVMLASATVPLMGLTDTAVIGQLGDTAMLGGLAIGAILFDLIFTGLNFLPREHDRINRPSAGCQRHRRTKCCSRSRLTALRRHWPSLNRGF